MKSPLNCCWYIAYAHDKTMRAYTIKLESTTYSHAFLNQAYTKKQNKSEKQD
jgi:hypothetical protein